MLLLFNHLHGDLKKHLLFAAKRLPWQPQTAVGHLDDSAILANLKCFLLEPDVSQLGSWGEEKTHGGDSWRRARLCFPWLCSAGMTKKFQTVTHPCVWSVLSHVCYQLPCMWESPRRRSDIMLCVKLDTVQHRGCDWENRGKWEIDEKKLERMETDKDGCVRPASTLHTRSVFISEFYIYTAKKNRVLRM